MKNKQGAEAKTYEFSRIGVVNLSNVVVEQEEDLGVDDVGSLETLGTAPVQFE